MLAVRFGRLNLSIAVAGLIFAGTSLAQDTESFEYDALGRLVKSENLSTGKEIEYFYDAAGNRTHVDTNGGAVIQFSIGDASATEGGTTTFTVTRSGTTAQSHSVDYATSNNTAVSGSDYTSKSGTLTFSSGQTSKSVAVATNNDSTFETGENFFVNLSNATNGASVNDSQGVGSITDNDSAPAFSISNVSVSEGGNLSFAISKSGSTSQSHAVSYSSANGSANGADYTSKSGTLTFTAGQSVRNVSISTTSDSTYENNETLYVNLSNSTGGATISDSQGVGTINNNDPGPSFSINNASRTEAFGPMVFTVTKSGATAASHSVTYATSSGSASTADYFTRTGTLTFSAGQTTKTISVPITSDPFQESTESFYVNLSSPTNSATISDSQGIGTIFDDDTGCEQFCE